MSDNDSSPKAPPFDRERVVEFTRQAKRLFKLVNKIEEQEDEILKMQQVQRKDRQQHERELELVMRSSHDTASALVAATLAAVAGAGSHAGAAVLEAKKSSPLLSELVEDYKRDKLAAKRWTPKTQDENLAVYKLCIDIIGDLPISEIGEDEALTYFETMQKLPPNMNKMPAYKGKTIAEIIALNPTPMAARTINKSLERISSLFKFATLKPKYDLRYNPFSGRSLDESDGQQREPFTNDELARLFGAAEHAQRQYTTAYSYWLPIMGLLTGARLNELCQLHLADFEVVGGIHCINIKDAGEGQRLKNKNAKRLVPIHDKLIEVGLIRYVDRLRAQGHDRLFPTLKLTDEGYGKMPSRWFGRFKERCGIMDKHTKVFHSFRHTFISTLLDNDVEETAIAPIVGHDGKLITGQVYWNVKDAVKRKPSVERFQPHPDVWKLVPKFEEVEITDD
jgi:integrase